MGADEYIGLTNDAKVRIGPIFYPRGTGTGADRTKRSEYRAALGTGRSQISEKEGQNGRGRSPA